MFYEKMKNSFVIFEMNLKNQKKLIFEPSLILIYDNEF